MDVIIYIDSNFFRPCKVTTFILNRILLNRITFSQIVFLAGYFFIAKPQRAQRPAYPLSVAFAFSAPLRETFLLIFTFRARFSDRADYPAPSNGVHHESRAPQENNKNQLFSVIIGTTKVWAKSTTTLLSTRCTIFHIACHQYPTYLFTERTSRDNILLQR